MERKVIVLPTKDFGGFDITSGKKDYTVAQVMNKEGQVLSYKRSSDYSNFLHGDPDRYLPWFPIGTDDPWAWLKEEAEIIALNWILTLAATGLLICAIQFSQ